MDDEEEMKNQCFGGEYVGEVSILQALCCFIQLCYNEEF